MRGSSSLSFSTSSSSTSISTLTQDSLLVNINNALSSVPIDDISILLKKYSASIDPKFDRSFLSDPHFLFIRARRIAICGHVAHIIQVPESFFRSTRFFLILLQLRRRL
jgi:hypothetical protein